MICLSDLHLRSDVPRCRGETEQEWLDHQFGRLNYVVKYALAYNHDIAIAGDIFHRATNPEYLVNLFLKSFSMFFEKESDLYIMAGNHDILYRTTDSLTSYDILATISKASSLVHLIGESWGDRVDYGKSTIITNRISGRDYLFLHTLTFESAKDVPYGVEKFETPETLVEKYPGYKFIVVGDQHRGFVKKVGDTTVINCGCLTPQSVNEKEYDNGFYVIEGNKVSKQYFTDTPIYRDTVRATDKRQDANRISKALEGLVGYEGKTIDFEEKLREKLLTLDDKHGKVGTIVINMIEEARNGE